MRVRHQGRRHFSKPHAASVNPGLPPLLEHPRRRDLTLASRALLASPASMNTFSSPHSVTITFSGHFNLDHAELAQFLRENTPPRTTESPDCPGPTTSTVPPSTQRLAYTTKEAAEVLGVSYVTVYRLLQRGLLRSSNALRHKLIPRSEIERFLKATLSD